MLARNNGNPQIRHRRLAIGGGVDGSKTRDCGIVALPVAGLSVWRKAGPERCKLLARRWRW
jgi:hypothetical protein